MKKILIVCADSKVAYHIGKNVLKCESYHKYFQVCNRAHIQGLSPDDVYTIYVINEPGETPYIKDLKAEMRAKGF